MLGVLERYGIAEMYNSADQSKFVDKGLRLEDEHASQWKDDRSAPR